MFVTFHTHRIDLALKCHRAPHCHDKTLAGRPSFRVPRDELGDGLYEARPCTGTSDTICDACGARDHGHADGRQCRHSSDGPARQRHGDHRRADISTDPPPTPRRPDGDAGAPESLAAPSSLSSSYSFVGTCPRSVIVRFLHFPLFAFDSINARLAVR